MEDLATIMKLNERNPARHNTSLSQGLRSINQDNNKSHDDDYNGERWCSPTQARKMFQQESIRDKRILNSLLCAEYIADSNSKFPNRVLSYSRRNGGYLINHEETIKANFINPGSPEANLLEGILDAEERIPHNRKLLVEVAYVQTPKVKSHLEFTSYTLIEGNHRYKKKRKFQL
ncbi:hypothetical protein HOD05_05585 [Candidatus Woesearchaeota archaeon]|jgi:hypothetical protein|nr:hypothetical protein [Candidatus Woesearchaeota archaeon]MBT4150482.1 hypothetical protein [Candidatus Woesearchaeota archaeon]MBT4247122.1 hypothetical protein [Candidatus Woesearchaeota archaeon]MBT4434652.1 hypothetical protein [Candidatus Woesearchaeota archaeon]MBT7331748.1 hypothetical protein [Candidatus Woesearchaeota archaeon]